MYKKVCPNCKTTSYSITAEQTWLCPNCQHDLTHIDAINFTKKNLQNGIS